jgi:hypothetical protein
MSENNAFDVADQIISLGINSKKQLIGNKKKSSKIYFPGFAKSFYKRTKKDVKFLELFDKMGRLPEFHRAQKAQAHSSAPFEIDIRNSSSLILSFKIAYMDALCEDISNSSEGRGKFLGNDPSKF